MAGPPAIATSTEVAAMSEGVGSQPGVGGWFRLAPESY